MPGFMYDLVNNSKYRQNIALSPIFWCNLDKGVNCKERQSCMFEEAELKINITGLMLCKIHKTLITPSTNQNFCLTNTEIEKNKNMKIWPRKYEYS